MNARTNIPSAFDPVSASKTDYARYYRKEFRMQVIPAMVPGCAGPWKRPAIGSWRNCTQTLCSEDRFTAWFPPNFHQNVGIITGVNDVWILDIDCHKKPQAQQWLEDLINIHNNGVSLETATQRTGGGGFQLVFTAPAGWTPPTFKTDIGVDIRGVGGFAVMPPSIHETGNQYAWLPGKEPWIVGVIIAPAWLTDAVDNLRRVSAHSADQTERTTPPEHPTNSLGLRVDGREDYMTRFIWAKVVAMFRLSAWGMQRGDPSPPTDTAENMREAFRQYLHKVDSRIDETGTPKEVLLDREGRGLALFREKWHRAIAQWDGKVKDAASLDHQGEDPLKSDAMLSVRGDTDLVPRSLEDLLVAAQNVNSDDIKAISALVEEAARLDPVKRDKVLRVIKKKTGIGMGALRESISQSSSRSAPDQLGLARSVIVEIGRENILFTDGALWQWNPCGVWREIDERVVKQKLQCCAESKIAKVSAPYINGALDLLKSEVLLQDNRFNLGNPETVNCLNGELELSNPGWHLAQHRRELYRTTQIPVAYDPKATAPSFLQFLHGVFLNDMDIDAKIQSLLELMGYTLMSHARYEKFVMLIGPGANGKSVLLAVLEALCGPSNVAGVQPAKFDNTFQRAHLHQKLANIITELKQGETIADAELKAITSGEPSTVERKFCDPFVMHPFSTCWFGTNHMPHTRDFSDAFFRRAVILTFNRTFETHEQDPMLKDKLKAELPGILNMALNAYAQALLVGFTEPQSSQAAKAEWRLEADQVALFVDERCQRQRTGKETIDNLFNAYVTWAQSQGISKTVGKKGFRDRLNGLGFGYKRTASSRLVVGLVLTLQVRPVFHQ
jgi:putative DNA primase/helicase